MIRLFAALQPVREADPGQDNPKDDSRTIQPIENIGQVFKMVDQQVTIVGFPDATLEGIG
jgi:hypothetical protein